MPAASDTQVADDLYRSHFSWLRQWLFGRLGCNFKAEDFAQDTFFRVLTRKQNIEVEHPCAFLSRIASRLLIDHSRRLCLERAWLETQLTLHSDHLSMPSVEQLHEFIDTLEWIARSLEGLPEKPRKAFLLYQLEGMRQADIAAHLGVSVSMVKKYIAQGLVYCHLALREY